MIFIFLSLDVYKNRFIFMTVSTLLLKCMDKTAVKSHSHSHSLVDDRQVLRIIYVYLCFFFYIIIAPYRTKKKEKNSNYRKFLSIIQKYCYHGD